MKMDEWVFDPSTDAFPKNWSESETERLQGSHWYQWSVKEDDTVYFLVFSKAGECLGEFSFYKIKLIEH